MDITPIHKKNNNSDLEHKTIYTAPNDSHAAIDQLFTRCAKLQEVTHTPTLDEVEALRIETSELEKKISKRFKGKGMPILRLFSRIRMFSEYFKILQLKRQINGLRIQAEKSKEQSIVERFVWQITRRGFTTSLDEKGIHETFLPLKNSLHAIGCSHAFTFRVVSREDGRFEFFLLGENSCQKIALCLKKELGKITVLENDERYKTIDEFIASYAKDAICLNQLQDVAMWLEKHGASVCDLKSSEIEEKLTKLMDRCPHGAYIMYPGIKGTITLSRLLHQGDVHHFTIDLKRQPGSYTFDLKGSHYSASRSEFIRKLSQMGTAVRLKE